MQVCNVHTLRIQTLTQRFFAPQVFDPPVNLSKTLSLTMGNPTGLFSLIQALKCIYMYSLNVLVVFFFPDPRPPQRKALGWFRGLWLGRLTGLILKNKSRQCRMTYFGRTSRAFVKGQADRKDVIKP